MFGCYCYILKNKDIVGKCYPKYDNAIFLGYFTTYKECRVYKLRTQTIGNGIHIIFDNFEK